VTVGKESKEFLSFSTVAFLLSILDHVLVLVSAGVENPDSGRIWLFLIDQMGQTNDGQHTDVHTGVETMSIIALSPFHLSNLVGIQ
jgi:hypothetical protein